MTEKEMLIKEIKKLRRDVQDFASRIIDVLIDMRDERIKDRENSEKQINEAITKFAGVMGNITINLKEDDSDSCGSCSGDCEKPDKCACCADGGCRDNDYGECDGTCCEDADDSSCCSDSDDSDDCDSSCCEDADDSSCCSDSEDSDDCDSSCCEDSDEEDDECDSSCRSDSDDSDDSDSSCDSDSDEDSDEYSDEDSDEEYDDEYLGDQYSDEE